MAIAVVDRQGNIIYRIQHSGRGPIEYNMVSSPIVDFEKRHISVLDWNRNRYITYSFGGSHVNTVVLKENIGSVTKLPDGNFIVFSSSLSESPYLYSIYDRDGNQIRTGGFKRPEIRSRMVTRYGISGIFNGKCYFREPFGGDTLYCVTSAADIPYELLDLGSYKAPVEAYADFTKFGPEYVNIESEIISGRYHFLKYFFDNRLYMDIRDLYKGDLVFHNVLSQYDEPLPGFPVEIGGKTVYCWPDFVHRDDIYCVLTDQEAAKLVEIDDSYNYVIVHLRPKP